MIREKNLTGDGKEIFFKKKSFNMQREEKSKRKYFHKPSPKRHRFLRKVAYCLAEIDNNAKK